TAAYAAAACAAASTAPVLHQVPVPLLAASRPGQAAPPLRLSTALTIASWSPGLPPRPTRSLPTAPSSAAGPFLTHVARPPPLGSPPRAVVGAAPTPSGGRGFFSASPSFSVLLVTPSSVGLLPAAMG
ncbi:unnamed protein product, partial [Urochloa humidicola]